MKQKLLSSAAFNFRRPVAWIQAAQPVKWKQDTLLPEKGMLEATVLLQRMRHAIEAR